MKSFRKLFSFVIVIIILVFVSANILMITVSKDDSNRLYRVEISRITPEIQNGTFNEKSLEKYEHILSVEKLTENNKDNFYNPNNDFIIQEINGEIYRFEYSVSSNHFYLIMAVNICLAVFSAVLLVILIVIQHKIIKPFEQIREVPFELSKGNLTVPLKENPNSYFGKFVWGLDLLREKLEQQKIKESDLQKKNKTLILSLSHDIKTPLGIIELYAKALEKGLYTDENKKKEVTQNINIKCNEIKNYGDGIIKASNENFLNLEVNDGEFYLSEIMEKIQSFYHDKLNFLKIGFHTEHFSDCLLFGDVDRAVEVLQNIIENAVKYGDGKNIGISFDFDKDEDCQIIKITNSGCTLHKNELPHIFESFWRGSNIGSNSGSGLGLYICRQLMHKMNGEIFAELKDGNITVCTVFQTA